MRMSLSTEGSYKVKPHSRTSFLSNPKDGWSGPRVGAAFFPPLPDPAGRHEFSTAHNQDDFDHLPPQQWLLLAVYVM